MDSWQLPHKLKCDAEINVLLIISIPIRLQPSKPTSWLITLPHKVEKVKQAHMKTRQASHGVGTQEERRKVQTADLCGVHYCATVSLHRRSV